MDLKEFVATTIRQLVEAVAETQSDARALGAYVSPAMDWTDGGGTRIGKTPAGDPVFGVSFDVAVTAGSSDSAEGRAKLEVVSLFSIGGKVATAGNQEVVSRVQFVVPLALPVDREGMPAKAPKHDFGKSAAQRSSL